MENTTVQPVPPAQQGLSHNPFSSQRHGASVNQGTTQIEESRAVAQQQAAYLIAAMKPRNEAQSYVDVMNACKRKGLAEEAIYTYSRGGSDVSGPTIRLAEEIARCWGNIDFGIVELSQGEGFSEMKAYATDLQTNTSRSTTFVVKHERKLKSGARVTLDDPRDIYETNANMGARRLRAMILSIVPADLVDDAVEACYKTLAGGDGVPLAERIKKCLAMFDAIGVKVPAIEKRFGKAAKDLTAEEVVKLGTMYKAIAAKEATIDDFFGGDNTAQDKVNNNAQKPAQPPRKKEEAKADEPAEKPLTKPGKERAAAKEQPVAPATPVAPVAPVAPPASENPLEGAGEEW